MSDKPVALLSVTDKTGICDFAKALVELGFEIFSTGGTAKALQDAQIQVTSVSTYTDFPEILNGRVKTLHPKVHAGIMYDRQNADHVAQARQFGARDISIVAVNLYQFVEKAVSQQMPLGEAIEYIDIGGPTMIRAAAKNYQNVYAVIDPRDYGSVIESLGEKNSSSENLREQLALKVYDQLARYNDSIGNYFHLQSKNERSGLLRYGENPHQQAFVKPVDINNPQGFANLKQHQGKELSYNNYLDLDAAWGIVTDLSSPAVSIVKHNNPCGAASRENATLEDLYREALACDSKSAFGGIVAANRPVSAKLAEQLSEIFLECVVAPQYEPRALEIFAKKKNLRVIEMNPEQSTGEWQMKSIAGALLLQSSDAELVDDEKLKVCTGKSPDEDTRKDLLFAMNIAKHVKSNAIVYVKNGRTLGIGAGQMSRIDAAELGIKKAREAGLEIKGSAMASDAFFPFRDTVDFAAKHGVSAVIQPGGSIKDQDSVDAADEHGLVMMMTGMRHFRH